MLIKGDKIKLVKPMGCFDNIGEICEVLSITADAIIAFRFGQVHLGCMSYNEFENYFEKVETEQETQKATHKWTEWKRKTVKYQGVDLDFKMTEHNVSIEYRNNGVKVQVRTFDLNQEYFIRASSKCKFTDKFDEDRGLKLAVTRLIVKLLHEETEESAKHM